MNAKRQIMDKKANFLRISSIQTEYEKILKDYSDFLTTAENKLKIKKVTVRDFDHLKQQLGTYKDFFSDMESYQVLLDSLVKNCSEGVREQYRSEHARLSDCTDHVQGLANLHGQQLSSYVNQWNDFNTQFDKMMLQIKEMNKRCHSLSADLDSGVNLSAAKDIIKNCQETQEQLTPDVFQTLDQGKQILHNVNSASLEAQVTTLANEWSQLHFFTSELSKRLEEVYDKTEQYKNQMAIWSTWLERSKINLATLRNLQEDDASNISVIRNKMEKLLEFRKDIDSEAVGKNKLIFIGSRLQNSHPAIAAKMNINVDQIEEQWAELKHDIGRAEQTLHQAQMELLPSRQALNELITFINKLQNVFKEDKKKPINKMNKIGPMLNKYKKFKIEMENKALTMDFVNQCVLKPNDDDDDSASALEEKKDFARRLSKLQQDWAKVEEQLNSQLNGLSLFEDKWEEFDQFQKNLANWFSDMEEKIKKRDIIGMEVNVKHTLKECQILQEKAVAKESDIDHLKALGNQLLELELAPTGSQKIVKEKVDSMQKKWQAVCKHLQQQMKHLQGVLEKWNEFSTEKAFVLDLLAKLEYYLSNHSNFIPGNYYSIKMQLSKMKAQSEEIQQESKKMEHLTKLSTELCQVCETPIKQDIQKSTSNIQNRWKTLTLQLKEHIELLEYLVERLKIYNEKYQAFSEELAHMEKSLDDMVFNYDNNQVEKYWKEIQDLQDKLDIFQSKLSELYQLSDDMGPNLDTVSVVNITSQQATLEERLLLLRHSADRFHQQMTDIRLQLKNFEQSLENISSFLQRAETILQNTNIQEVQSLSAEEALPRETLIQFKELLVEFNVNATSLDSLNELGYRMALDTEKVQQLQDLNHKWYQLQSCVLQHCHCLQDSVLLHQNFTEKCTAWMSHLAQIENLLAEDIGGSFEELLNQQKKYQTLTSELTNKQQLLHAIIADGQKMQTVGDATDSDFENNLKRLSMQWQNVVKRINQRKTTVDNLISTWKNFNDQILWFDRWLEDKESTLRALDIDMASMRCKLNIMEKVKNIENEFKMQDDRYNSILDVSQKLLQYTSGEPETNLLFRLKNLQDKRASVIGALDLQTSKLQTTVKQWELCDKQVEELLAWLRDMHNVSGKVLPTSYEDLEAELHRCQDLQVSCSIYEDKYQVLFVNVNQLNHIVQPEDVSLLQQRMKLWHKQWTELCVQLDVRILQVKRKLEMWPQYSTDVNKFCTWCEQMEDKVRTMNGHNIETMLAKFEEEYECELNAKEQEKDSLIHQGEALQKCSSEVHSSDIALRSQQVEQKWQHLQAIVSNRKHKLKETLQAMQQFDRDTDNLRKWLQQMEDKLNAPLVYTECDYKEIETHLEHQKDMQKDIERHSAGVSSVLNLCEVLLHDSDACRTDKESAALNNTKNTLEKRWQVICKLSTQREASIKETRKQLQCFMTLYNDFSAWLDDTEKALQKYDESSPESKNSQHRYYQEIQRKISEKINQLENLKKQYEILVKGGFTDSNGSLEKKVQEANNRWEELSRKVQNITKITKKNIVSWEEYHNLHKVLCDWLNDVDSRIREFEKSDNVPGKSECLKKIQEQQQINSSKFKRFKHVTDQLLNETGDTQNSRLQIEVDEFYDLHDWVIGRLNSLLLPADQYPEEPLPEVEHDDYAEIETYLKSSPPVSPPSQRRDSSRYAVGIPYTVNKEEWWLRFKEELSSNSKEALDAYNEEMLNALEDCAHKLIIAEEALRCHTPVGPELDHQTSNYIKIMADCQASVENVQRVYTKIKNELGLMTIVTVEQEVSNVSSRWKRLRSCIIEKDLKLQNNRKDWSQFNTDLDNINKWLKARDNWLNSINVSELSIPQMGGIIKELKDFQDELKSKQTIVESLKLTGGIFCEGPLEENQLTKRRLQMMHIKWEELTARCEHLVGELRRKLSESDYFHEEVERMLIWINQMEAKVQEHQPHNIDQHENNVQWQYDSLQSLKSEIKQQQPHISALKETSRHLHKDTISPAVAKSKDDIHIIAARAHSLLQQIMTCLNILESRLDFKKTLISRDVPRSSSSSSPPCSPVPMADSNTILINDDNVDEVDEDSWTVTDGAGFDQEATSATDSHQALITPLLPEDRHVITSSVDYKPMSYEKTRLKPTEAKDDQFETDDDELFLDTEEKVEAILKDDLETEKPCEILEDDETDAAVAGPCTCSSFCRRVFWIALPIQGLLLLLLGLASLLPMTEDDYSCALTNNMQRSFTSVLHYVNGPPPV
ncbi:SYNE1 [Acanthosepion pharaonis]|uniref:SYNE1 n=1 Tax=Acanthosepion pharaonis TaxID=158019 RepID=A0A812EUW9_ACAPH|nr:SYNE1 [Sepia pharaonis]